MIAATDPDLRQHWRAFLVKNPDTRLTVDGAMARTGLTKDEVLFVLIEAWLAQVQRKQLDDRVSTQSTTN